MVNPAVLAFAAQPNPPGPTDRLPDSSHQWGICPRCDRQSNFSVAATQNLTFDYAHFTVRRDGPREPQVSERICVLLCQGCRQGVLVVEEIGANGVPKRLGGTSGTITWHGLHWWPSPGMQALDPDIPAGIADAVAEGTRCLAAQAPRAAAVLFRGALALIVEDRGSGAAKAKKTLFAQLKQMAVDKDLDSSLAELADHVRVVGNASAHPATLDPVSLEEAAELAEFIGHLLRFLYVMPARVQRSRAKRPK
ncbi:DUF4145 domain-containing protein [Streptomyces sp. HUAS TT7]|uniref:DUF4145 domain-containing protein n=1 Tax=Streptomyces sp. HUAS TT7 TaxID=3447507 RepID=UPI003F65FC17